MSSSGNSTVFPAEMLPNNPFLFPGGDVRLKVTYNSKHMVGSVSSQAMASACKVWKNFVFPPWAVLPVEELDFTEDDSDALLILLRIAHSDFANVPTTVSYTELLNLAILCDQYDCIKMTKNWIEGWLEGETILSIKPGYENWLFIAWVFGRTKVFDDLAIHLVRTICIDEDGYCMNSQKKHLAGPFPPDIIESICDVRIEVLHQLWNPMHQDFNRYDNRQGPICPYPGSRQNQLDCDAKIHNSCKFVLMMLGLSPQKPRCEIWYSFNELCERLRGITIERHDPSHFFCISYIRNNLSYIPSPVKRFHVEHMNIQRASLLSESATDLADSTTASLA